MSEARVTVAAVGDIILDRPDPHAAFELVGAALRRADIRIGNCEAAYTDAEDRLPSGAGWAVCSPDNIAGFAAGGFDVMGCANNKTMDAGYRGLRDTLRGLREAGIEPVGAGES